MKILNCIVSFFIIAVFYTSSLAQANDLPPNHEPGKCYAKCQMPEGDMDWTEVLCNNQVNADFILELQSTLKSKGFYHGELDRQFSNDLKSALKKFQTENNLPQGQLDMTTLSALNVMYGQRLDAKLKQEKKEAKQAAKLKKKEEKGRLLIYQSRLSSTTLHSAVFASLG